MIAIESIESVDIHRDRKRQIRDRLLCALEDAGRAMTPRELSRATGLGVQAISISALGHEMYFTVRPGMGGKVVGMIDRHWHLKVRA